MGGRNASNPWGSNKVQRTLSVTDEAWNQWTKAADDADINRSEMFEVLARMAHLLGVYELRTRLLSERKQSTAKKTASTPAALK
jgi:hypothetical protein